MNNLTPENTEVPRESNTIESLSIPDKIRRWSLTLNNYSEEEFNDLTQIFKEKHWLYIIGKEVGESGTPHLQMYIEHKNAIRFDCLKNLNNRLHIEPSFANKNKNIEYCAKENNFISNFKNIKLNINSIILKNEYENVIWKPWQNNILEYIKTNPDKRRIKWLYETTGCVGKSFVMKYICLKNKGVIIADGKKTNILNQVLQMKLTGIEPNIIIVDVPRSCFDYLNYGCLETLKNGVAYSGKYEGGICIFEIPHIIIFANQKPDMTQWSRDRYDIEEVTA